MPTIDLAFSLLGTKPIPADHGYHLYAALSRLLPATILDLRLGNGIGVHPIRGRQIGHRELTLEEHSRLILRASTDAIGSLIQLAGKQLNVAGTNIRVGVPQVWSQKPAPALRSRLVIIKTKDAPNASALTAETFQAAARRQLDDLGVSPEANLTLGKRRTSQLTSEEHDALGSHSVILKGGGGAQREYLPYVVTELGVTIRAPCN